ncbi:MAG: phytoene/squalene synthase family protein [Bacteroidales bacterium]|nr:phytoene/squalene synthase family protein [Bacteroidales bacterium]
MKELFDMISKKSSKLTTLTYSTSFSMGIRVFNKRFHDPIYAIYGFVRFADEIVDSFHDFDKKKLLENFKRDTYAAIDDKISLNPILNNFQWAVNTYKIDHDTIHTFLRSMEMDLHKETYDRKAYEAYILGSAEVVGLMCLRVFCEGDKQHYEELKPSAMRLGAAFQKINFLRDLQQDYKGLGRSYFPGIDITAFDQSAKAKIEQEIEADFNAGLEGIRKLPDGARFGVYLAYIYFYTLFKKIKKSNAERLLRERVRVSDTENYALLFSSFLRTKLRMI